MESGEVGVAFCLLAYCRWGRKRQQRVIVASSRTQSELTSHRFEIRNGNLLQSPSTSTLYSFIPNHITPIYLPHRPQRSNPRSLACLRKWLSAAPTYPIITIDERGNAKQQPHDDGESHARQASGNSCCSWRISATYALQNCCTAKLHGS